MLLSHLRMLDLTDEWGLMAGSIFADLGVDVIQVEPPGGSHARTLGPFAGAHANRERSLFWWGYARNKRSIELDLTSQEGKRQFISLLESADCLVESMKPEYLSSLGLGYEEISRIYPWLVMTSITPFGQSGPKARWPASDLTVMSAAGYQYTCGDHDRAPLRIAVPQAYAHASMAGVTATLLALRERQQSGLGQHVDVSAQEVVAGCCVPSQLAEPWGESPMARRAGGYMVRDVLTRTTYPARDGYVSISFSFGSTVGPATQRFVSWMYAEGGCDESIRDKDYVGFGRKLLIGDEPLSELARIHEMVARFTATKTKAELLQAAQAFDLLIAPSATIVDVRHDRHLAARNFYQPLATDSGTICVPGPFAKFSGAELAGPKRAPRIGEHTSEILAEPRTRPRRPSTKGTTTHDPLPLAGLKVLDFGWAMVEPSSMRVLSDYGATVVKVESTKRFDTLRSVGNRNGGFDPDCSLSFQDFNAGKMSIALDLGRPEGQGIIRRLVEWADVLGESFTPTAMRRWNLHYEALREVNPRLIYLSTCLGGQFGPYSTMAGYGNLSAALAGFDSVCGWPDRAPAGPNGYYTDYVTPPFVVTAVLAALDHHDRTGVGQHIDIAQAEAPVHFLTPAILDYEVNGRVIQAGGNRSEDMAPHGVFSCLGHDRWIALAVEDDVQWTKLCALIGRPELANDPRFESLASRKRNEDELEREVTNGTSRMTAEAVQELLIAAGIAAHVVSDARDLYNDPQLHHRNHWVTVPHATLGDLVVESTRFKLSRTPGRTLSAAPSVGQHAFEVLSTFAGYSEDEIADFAAAGVLQ